MSWTKVKGFYGLKRPFNFNVAIPFLLNTCVLSLVLVVCAFLFLDGGLSIGTKRFYFFLYTACLLAIAAALSKARKLSYAILLWCTLELSLAFGSDIVAKGNALPSLFPQNETPESEEEFVYHPLLQRVPRPNYRYSYQLDFEENEDKAKAAGIDVASLQGMELHFVHNSLGLRGEELTAHDLGKNLIFVYGGSTTYDIAVTQGQSWVEDLQSELRNKYTVVNFGVPGHSTVEHLIQTAFYQDIVGKQPVCAAYYVGWNEIDSAHIKHLDSGYADSHLLRMAERKPFLSLAPYSPLVLFGNALAVRRFDTVPWYPQLRGKPPVSGNDERLEAIFIDHVRTIAAINEARDIRTIFIGQILNKDWPSGNHFLVRGEDVIPLVERLKTILKSTAVSIGAKYIDPGIVNFGGNDFIDQGHFQAQGSKKLAALVFKEVDDYCQ